MDFRDLVKHGEASTRGSRKTDGSFSNLPGVRVTGTLPPLETELDDGAANGTRKSDHKVAFFQADVPKNEPYEVLEYEYRYYNAESEAKYGRWLAQKDWSDDQRAIGSNAKTELYQREVVGALEVCFPLVKVRRRSNNPPWYNWKVKKRIAQSKGIYRREGRSAQWRWVRSLLESLIERRREKYAGSQKDALLAKDGSRNFFKNVRCYKSVEREKPFNVRSLFPGKSNMELAELLADHFNTISNKFDPLEASQIPVTRPRGLPVLLPHQVAGRIRCLRSQSRW